MAYSILTELFSSNWNSIPFDELCPQDGSPSFFSQLDSFNTNNVIKNPYPEFFEAPSNNKKRKKDIEIKEIKNGEERSVKSKKEIPSFLSYLPKVVITHISRFLSENDNGKFRQTEKKIKESVDKGYQTLFQNKFEIKVNTLFKDILEDTSEHRPYVNMIKQHVVAEMYNELPKKMPSLCEQPLLKTGYLYVSQGSYLEGYLSQNYISVLLYDYLENRPEETKELFNALFGKNIPVTKYDLALHLLTGCLPSNHIYVPPETEETDDLMSKFEKILLEFLKKRNKGKYFLLGIDEDFTVLNDKEHVIVINQSAQQRDLDRFKDYPHKKIILNANQEVLTMGNLPENMKELILVNGHNKCTSIKKKFVKNHSTLRSCIATGLINVRKIEDMCFFGCPKLRTFNSTGLTHLTHIEDKFLYTCTNLSILDSIALRNLTHIGAHFLSNSKNLFIFYCKNLTNLTIIKDFFLMNCINLHIFDGTDLSNLTHIGKYFLCQCENLIKLIIKDLEKVKIVGEDFLEGCKKINFDKIDLETLNKNMRYDIIKKINEKYEKSYPPNRNKRIIKNDGRDFSNATRTLFN